MRASACTITGGMFSLPNTESASPFTTPGDNGTGANDWMLVVDTKDAAVDPGTGREGLAAYLETKYVCVAGV